MGGNEVDGYFTIQRALDIARNSEGVVDPTVSSYLERALRDVWASIEAAPEDYVLTKDEFALFNYFRHRFTTSNIAQSAVQRFWDNYQGDPVNPQDGSNGSNGTNGTNGTTNGTANGTNGTNGTNGVNGARSAT